MKDTSDPLTPQKHCSVCLKKNRLKQLEILDLANCNPNFECTSCSIDKFLFVLQDNLDIQKQSFNSNFL